MKSLNRFLLVAGLTAFASLSNALGQNFTIDWYTIDGGGAMNSTGGTFSLSGTIGQPDAGPQGGMSGGAFSLTGGFWVVGVPLPCGGFHPCDTNCDGSINLFDIDPFVAAIQTHHGCSACAGDTNADGTVNLFDIQGFVHCLGG